MITTPPPDDTEVLFAPHTSAVDSSASQQIPSRHQQPMIVVTPAATTSITGNDPIARQMDRPGNCDNDPNGETVDVERIGNFKLLGN